MMNLASLGKITCQDAVAGARAWRLWSKFAWHDLLSRYRHSWIGPLWLGLSAAIFLAGVSLIFGTLFQQPMSDYVPFVAIGIACWGFVAASVTEAAVTFIESESYIRHVRASLFVYVYRVFWRNVLVFLHQFAIALIVLLAFGKLNDVILSATLLGLLILLSQALWAIPLLGLIGAYFRDVQPIISSLLQVLIFVTPVIWFPSALGSRKWIADINPLNSLISVVRDPMLGAMPSAEHYVYVACVTFVGFLGTVILYGRFRNRLVYWL